MRLRSKASLSEHNVGPQGGTFAVSFEVKSEICCLKLTEHCVGNGPAGFHRGGVLIVGNRWRKFSA